MIDQWIMRWGVQTVLWGRNIANLRKTLRCIKNAGYAGIEIAQTPANIILDPALPELNRTPHSINDILRLCNEENVELIGLSGGGVKLRAAFCGSFRPTYLYVDSWDEDCASLLRLPQPFTLALHPHLFMPIGSLEIALEKLRYQDTRWIKLLPDTAHLTIMEREPSVVIRENKSKIPAIHLKDWRPEFGRFSHRYARGFCVLGEGIVQIPDIFNTLMEISYTGWLIVEQDSYAKGPELCIAENSGRLRKMNHAIGFPTPSDSTIQAPSEFQDTTPHYDSVDATFLGRLQFAQQAGRHEFLATIPRMLATHPEVLSADLWSVNSTDSVLYRLSTAGDHWISPINQTSYATGLLARSVKEHQYAIWSPGDAIENVGEISQRLKTDRLYLVLPVLNEANAHHCRYLLLIGINPAIPEVALTSQKLSIWAAAIARATDSVIDQECSLLVGRINYAATTAKIKSDFLKRILELIVSGLDAEAAAIFLRDSTGYRLEEAASTGTEWKVPLRERFYRQNDGITGRVWSSRGVAFSNSLTRNPLSTGKSFEKTISQDRDECLFVCLAERGVPALGVVRVTNRRQVSNPGCSTMFTDDDAAILDILLAGACPYLSQLLRQEAERRVLETLTHELKMPLTAITGATVSMDQDLKRNGVQEKDIFKEGYIQDIRDWVALLSAQIAKADIYRAAGGSLRLNARPCLLLRDIVAPAVNQARHVLLSRKLNPNAIEWSLDDRDRGMETEEVTLRAKARSIYYGRFQTIPELHLDRFMMQQVVFNLLSNAVKYGGHDDDFKILITAAEVEDDYIMLFSDWGPGIDPELKELVFEPGFRAPDQARSNVPGQGLGLSIVRMIVNAHGGAVRITKCRKPLTVNVRLPKALKLDPPLPKRRV